MQKEACEGQNISKYKASKPGAEVKVGDIIEIAYGDRKIKAEVLNINEKAGKDEAKKCIK